MKNVLPTNIFKYNIVTETVSLSDQDCGRAVVVENIRYITIEYTKEGKMDVYVRIPYVPMCENTYIYIYYNNG